MREVFPRGDSGGDLLLSLRGKRGAQGVSSERGGGILKKKPLNIREGFFCRNTSNASKRTKG